MGSVELARPLVEPGAVGGVGVDDDLAGRAVDRELHVRAGGPQRLEQPAGADHGRDPVRAGEDRGVRRRRARLEGDAEQALAGQGRGEGGGQVVGDDDRRRGEELLVERQAGQAPGDPIRDVEDVGRPGADERVGERGETRGAGPPASTIAVTASVLAVSIAATACADQLGIPGDRGMGPEDACLGIVAGLGDLVAQGHELEGGFVRRRAQPLHLCGRLAGRDPARRRAGPTVGAPSSGRG